MAGVAADAAYQHVQIRKVEAVELEGAVSRHQRIVFVPEAKGCGELGTNPVAVSNEKAELPFLGGGFDELIALAHAIGNSQQELREGIELVSRSAAIERRRPAVEIEFSAWARAQFRLPVIQVVVNDVRASTDLVLAMGPADVVRAGEAPVVAEGGVPSLWVANRREARNDK